MLDDEASFHAGLVAQLLGPRVAGLQVGHERMCLHGGGARLRLGLDDELRGEIRASLDLETLVALVDERLTLTRALEQRRLAVCGRTEDLRAASDAFRALVHGLVRAPSSPSLLATLRRLHAREGTES